jgi:hypothetical protein
MEGAPNHPKTFGEELRRLRESAGLSLEDIATETKISKQILQSLENGEFRFLPQKVFSRNFVSQYAVVVGADPAVLTVAFDGAWDRFLLASGIHLRISDDDVPFVPTVRWRFWLPVGITAAILLAAVIVIVRGTVSGRNLAVAPQSTERSERMPTPMRRTMTTPTNVPAVELQQENSIASVVITVQPEMECWIHFRNRDGVAGGKLLAGGTVERLELAIPGKLTVGDAGAVTLEVAGQTYQDLGRSGQVVHTRINSDGLTVLGSRPDNG